MSVIRVSRCQITRGTLSGRHVLTLIRKIMTGGLLKIVLNWAGLSKFQFISVAKIKSRADSLRISQRKIPPNGKYHDHHGSPRSINPLIDYAHQRLEITRTPRSNGPANPQRPGTPPVWPLAVACASKTQRNVALPSPASSASPPPPPL